MFNAEEQNEDTESMDAWKAALDAELSAWRLRSRTLGGEIAKLQAERDELDQKARAAEILLGRPHIPEMHDEDRVLNVREAIASLMQDGKPRNAPDIRAALVAAGFDASKVGTASGAFYNALARLTQRDVLVKSDAGVYRLKGAPEEEGVFG